MTVLGLTPSSPANPELSNNQTKPMKPKHCLRRSLLLTGSIALSLSSAQAADGTWESTGGGDWSDETNWESELIADGTDSTATFGLQKDGAGALRLHAANTLTG